MSAIKDKGFNSMPMVSMPGPMTCIDSLCCTKNFCPEAFYESEEACAADMAKVLNAEIKELAKAGCKYINIDEPVFVRYPEKVRAWGVRMLDACFEGVDLTGDLFTACHVCCSYPSCPKKADFQMYANIAPDLNGSKSIMGYSIEHAHQPLDLASVLPTLCGDNKAVILGMCHVGDKRVESAEEI